MATTGHELEAVNVQGLKASLQKLKAGNIDTKADKSSIAAGEYNKVTVNSQGIVTAGSNPTTLAGHGITDAYTKTEVNGLVDTPHQNYVTVSATSQTTAATDVLPNSGQSADTIYRVSNWDGSANSGAGAFDATCYSEYAWDDVSNPNKYVFLCVKSQIGEVFDISVYNNNAKYADLAAALGNGGANIPQSLQKGGMSVKFVHSVDNNYVQLRYMSTSTAVADFTNAANWQGVDDKPTDGSNNFVKSRGVYSAIGAAEENIYAYKMIGNGNTAVMSYRNILPNRKYKISIKNPDIPTNELTVGHDYYILTLQIRINGVAQSESTIAVYNGETIKNTYIVNTPALQDGTDTIQLLTAMRANSGAVQFFTLEDITDSAEALSVANQSMQLIDELTEEVNNELYEGIKEDILSLNDLGYFYILSVGVGNEAIRQEAGNNKWNNQVVQCQQGDQFEISGYGALNPRLWAFTDSNNIIISVEDAQIRVGIINKIITAPENATKLICNFCVDSSVAGYVQPALSKIDGYVSKITKLKNDIENRLYNFNLVGEGNQWVGIFKNVLPSHYYRINIANVNIPTDEITLGSGNFKFGVNIVVNDVVGENVLRVNLNQELHDNYVFETPALVNDTDKISIRVVMRANSGAVQFFTLEDITNSGILKTDIVSLNDEEYTKRALANMKRPARSGRTVKYTPFVIGHFSDLHSDLTALKRIVEYKTHYASYIDDFIATGDIVQMTYDNWGDPNTVGSLANIWSTQCQDILFEMGNHESIALVDGSYVRLQHMGQELYDRFIAPFVSNWNLPTSPYNIVGKPYYFKDYSSYKIRLIVLDSNEYELNGANSEQIQWLTDVLSDTPSDYTVIATQHYPSDLDAFDCAFHSRQNPGNADRIGEEFLDCVDDFIESRPGKFACWISGHTHLDLVGTIRGHSKQVMITIALAGTGTGYSWADTERTVNTKSSDLFNLLAIDTYNKVIKVMRVGANIDSWMRYKNTMSIQYASNSMYTLTDDKPVLISCN